MSNLSDQAIDTLINYLKQKKLTYILDKLNNINLLSKLRRRKGDYILDVFAPPVSLFEEFHPEMLYVFNNETENKKKSNYPDLQLESNTIISWSKPVTIFDNTLPSAKNEDDLIIIPIKIYLYNGNIKTDSTTYKPNIGSSEKDTQKVSTKMLISSVRNGNGFNCGVHFDGYSLRKLLTSWIIYESNDKKEINIIYNLAASLIKYCFGWGEKESNTSLNYNLLLGEILSYSPYVTILSLIAPCVGLLSNTEIEKWDGLFDKSVSGKTVYEQVLKTLLKNSRIVNITPNFSSVEKLIDAYMSFCEKRYNNIFKDNEVAACSMLVTDIMRFYLLSGKNTPELSNLKHFVLEIYALENINKKILLNKMAKKESINSEFFSNFYNSDLVLTTINNSANNKDKEQEEKDSIEKT